jgi:hypothetical protein
MDKNKVLDECEWLANSILDLIDDYADAYDVSHGTSSGNRYEVGHSDVTGETAVSERKDRQRSSLTSFDRFLKQLHDSCLGARGELNRILSTHDSPTDESRYLPRTINKMEHAKLLRQKAAKLIKQAEDEEKQARFNAVKAAERRAKAASRKKAGKRKRQQA